VYFRDGIEYAGGEDYTGMRFCHVSALKWADWDERRQLPIGKISVTAV